MKINVRKILDEKQDFFCKVGKDYYRFTFVEFNNPYRLYLNVYINNTPAIDIDILSNTHKVFCQFDGNIKHLIDSYKAYYAEKEQELKSLATQKRVE